MENSVNAKEIKQNKGICTPILLINIEFKILRKMFLKFNSVRRNSL